MNQINLLIINVIEDETLEHLINYDIRYLRHSLETSPFSATSCDTICTRLYEQLDNKSI